ncbi:hypothetical protein SUGI_1041310 [Cryptomeria japonica]|uniref:uncharacterized protein LOC131038533 n=1 Tax=Cryptomeria japonica TaxID=3369 RepID=UPI00241473A2|nr:uncharacterized protein LOC131038533 [Cryptomeria japonica]GLJ49278.1 hypothetical protein SUGI_1041310 [Cryptomeria japonica]
MGASVNGGEGNGYSSSSENIAKEFAWVPKRKNGSQRTMRCAMSWMFVGQLVVAAYGTVMLLLMMSTVDLRPELPSPWSFQIAQKTWRGILRATSGSLNRNHGLMLVEKVESNLELPQSNSDVCEFEQISFEQKKSNDLRMIRLKKELYTEILRFQQRFRGCETLRDLMRLPSATPLAAGAKVTVILNHFKRKTLCAQLEALLQQTLPFHSVWVMALGSPNEASLRRIVDSYNNSRIFFVGSTYDFKYFGRFQLALQSDGADYVYIVDDDMIPGRRVLEIFAHAAGTEKYQNAVLGSIGRILPFRQKDFSFPSYRKFGAKEAGIYLPDPAYDILAERVIEVDFLSSGWFISTQLVKTLFIENPYTFATGEDLHLSYQLQKYRGGGSFVLPVDPKDKDTWADSEHRLAYVSETTVIFKDVIEVRDKQWWQYISRGYITQWARMYPQQSDVFFYAHSLGEIADLAPLISRYRNTPGRKAYVVVSGGSHCPCEKAAVMLGMPPTVCTERRFKIFDLGVGTGVVAGGSDVPIVQEVYASMKGLIAIHNPSVIVTVADLDSVIRDGLILAVGKASDTVLIQLPRASIPHALWMADVKPAALKEWNRMRISVNIITQNRAVSLKRLLDSLTDAYYVGDEIVITFNMDSAVDAGTLKTVDSFVWPYGEKIIRRRIIQGGLIRAVSESWYPSSDDDFGLLLEDDIEVSPFYYMWLKYALLAYHYDPQVSLPELNAIALYTPRVIEVVKERPKWNATEAFKAVHPNTPYLHQLPCSWGSLFFPQKWREFYKYMNMRYTDDAKKNPVQIPKSRTNGWQASWKKFLIDVMYLRGYVTLYPNFPNQRSFSTNHMEPGAHIGAKDNNLTHKKEDFEVPLMKEDFTKLFPQQKLPPISKVPVVNLFNQPSTLKGLKSAGSKLQQDVLKCKLTEVVRADDTTGEPANCVTF